jgi:hypothetical protein
MCIFVALPQDSWFILGSNRDDQAQRETDVAVTYDSNLHCQYVKDIQSWWTRLVVHDSWLYAVLLNHSPSVKNQVFPSRGELPLHVIDLLVQSLPDSSIDGMLEKVSIKNYNSCVLAVWKIQDWIFMHHIMTWDAVNQTLDTKVTTWKLFLAASTLYPDSTSALWAKDMEKISDIDWLQLFMDTHRYNVENLLCIPKTGTVTKSKSIISFSPDTNKVKYTYFSTYH